MKAIIVGGGVAGLSSAIALLRQGWQVEVLERAAEFGDVGAGISIWPNALRALDVLGLGEPVRRSALLGTQSGIRDSTGRWLLRLNMNTDEVARRFGPVAVLHRADLLEILRTALPREVLRPGVTVHGAAANGVVQHDDGESKAELVVGADGIRSAVRGSLWRGAAAPRYVGYTSWRMITSPTPLDDGGETWGRGERFGYAPLPDGRAYCFATANAPAGGTDTALAALRSRFASWHSPIPELLARVDEDAVLRTDISDLPALDTYARGRVVLVGDAAHAMTPDLGQGACQALEDAVVLAATVTDGGPAAYDRARRPRTQRIARRARLAGKIGQWSAPAATTARNAALRASPQSSFVRSLAPVLSWTP